MTADVSPLGSSSKRGAAETVMPAAQVYLSEVRWNSLSSLLLGLAVLKAVQAPADAETELPPREEPSGRTCTMTSTSLIDLSRIVSVVTTPVRGNTRLCVTPLSLATVLAVLEALPALCLANSRRYGSLYLFQLHPALGAFQGVDRPRSTYQVY